MIHRGIESGSELLRLPRHLVLLLYGSFTENNFFAGVNPFVLEPALESICHQAVEAVEAGRSVLILSDRGTSATRVPLPMLLAVGAIHHHLIREGKRLQTSIVCESGEACDVHQFACLVGYGQPSSFVPQKSAPKFFTSSIRHPKATSSRVTAAQRSKASTTLFSTNSQPSLRISQSKVA